MVKPEAILEETKNLPNFIKIASRAKRTISRIQKRKITLLQKIVAQAQSYKGLRAVQLESEEKNLLKKLEHLLMREEQYIALLVKGLKKFHDQIKELDASFQLWYFPGLSGPPVKIFFDAIYVMISRLEAVLEQVVAKIAVEVTFVKKWRGGTITHLFSFWRKRNVMTKFNEKLLNLRELYKDESLSIQAALKELPLLLADISKKREKVTLGLDAYTKIRREKKLAQEAAPPPIPQAKKALREIEKSSRSAGEQLIETLQYASIGRMMGGDRGAMIGASISFTKQALGW